MDGRTEVYLHIRPKDSLMDRSSLKNRLHALDEAFTQQFPGRVDGYNFDKECSEVWLYYESLEAQEARALIAKHGFEVREEEEIVVREKKWRSVGWVGTAHPTTPAVRPSSLIPPHEPFAAPPGGAPLPS